MDTLQANICIYKSKNKHEKHFSLNFGCFICIYIVLNKYTNIQWIPFFLWVEVKILKRRYCARLRQCVGFSPAKTTPTSSPISPRDTVKYYYYTTKSRVHHTFRARSSSCHYYIYRTQICLGPIIMSKVSFSLPPFNRESRIMEHNMFHVVW